MESFNQMAKELQPNAFLSKTGRSKAYCPENDLRAAVFTTMAPGLPALIIVIPIETSRIAMRKII